MKFTYAYKTSDGVRHEAAMDAESREAVFAALRAKGIKAIKVVAADGSKANGEIRGIRKRVLAASVVGAAILAVVGTVAYFRASRTTIGSLGSTGTLGTVASQTFDSTTRRQVIGDTAIIEKGIRTGWADVFEIEGERFLASFAIPGVPAGQRSTSEEKLREALHSTPTPSTYTSVSDGLEARQIRAMVEGMKDELRRYLAAGGTIAGYGKRLVERQEEEIAYYNRAKAEIEAAQKAKMPAAQLNDLWEKRNESLRQMGVKLVPMPE